MVKRKRKAKPRTLNFDGYRIATLDEFLVFDDLPQDTFGFMATLSSKEIAERFFAVFDIDGKIKATERYTEDTLKNMVIPDVLRSHPGAFYKIFPEADFERITGNKD